MFEHRRLILTEAQMEPEMVIACSHDIEMHCRQLNGGGETLHCLMRIAKRPPTSDYAGLSTQCFQAVRRLFPGHIAFSDELLIAQISKLLKVADVGSNYQVDQVLYRDCKPIIEGVCKKEAVSETEYAAIFLVNCHVLVF